MDEAQLAAIDSLPGTAAGRRRRIGAVRRVFWGVSPGTAGRGRRATRAVVMVARGPVVLFLDVLALNPMSAGGRLITREEHLP